MSDEFDPNEIRDDLEQETYGDYDYDYDEGYDGYSYLMVCPDVTIENVLRKWARAIKDWFWRLRHRNGVDDIPF